MAVTDTTTVDGCGLNETRTKLLLMIADHLSWEKEADHLFLLQEKINNYLAFCETKQYKSIFPDDKIEGAVIEIRFLYELPDIAIKFLKRVQEEIGQYGITISAYVVPEEFE